MDTNVGDMPLDIFCDYVSEILGEEWSWEYIVPILNDYGCNYRIPYGHGRTCTGTLGIDVRLYSGCLGAMGHGYRIGRHNNGQGFELGAGSGMGNGRGTHS